MTEYTKEFQELRAINDLEEIESQEILRYVTRLKEPLHIQVDVRNVAHFPKTVTTCYQAQYNKLQRN